MYFAALKLDFAFAFCEERIVSAHSDVFAGKEFRSALTDEYTAGFDCFSGIKFNTSILRITVSAVSC